MVYICARRLSDGLLTWAQATEALTTEALTTEARTALVNNAVIELGGVAGDWEALELTPEQYTAQQAAIPARSYLPNGDVVVQTAPTVTTDKTQIDNDGVDFATITANVHDSNYNGACLWRVRDTDNSETTIEDTATAGVATLPLATISEGIIHIEFNCPNYGVGFVEVEGI